MFSIQKQSALIFVFVAFFFAAARAANLDAIGVTLLRAATTNLNGAGVRVAQPEAGYNLVTNWEVNPAAVGQPASRFTYISANGSTANFPNSLSSESSHADGVAQNFYGVPSGVATNVAHVDNYDANYFLQERVVTNDFATNYIITLPAGNIGDPVVNQSFDVVNPDYSHVSTNEEASIDSAYDNYAAQYDILFVSGAGNGGPVNPPATSYNSIGVGVSDGSSSYGPTLDNGRCKPDLIAPGGDTSFSTPYVAGAAAVLMQAGLRGDGGGDTNSAADIRTVKALLLNGAVKPPNWTNSPSAPLHPLYGAGVLNVFNSYEQLAGGEHGWNFSTNVPHGTAHPPVAGTGTVPVLSGWDFNSIASASGGLFSSAADGVNHYFFNATNGDGGASFTAVATLVWNRQQNQSAINNLDLFLYNAVNSNLVACSTSLVDNVEHVFVPKLPQGRYDLQVWKAGGSGIVSSTETYALAWEFFSEPLDAAKSGTNLILSWLAYPAGFVVESTANLSPPQNWSTNNLPPPVFTNSRNVVVMDATNGAQFFRLRTP